MDRFVVGTGRCGSTLLSRMLAEHDSILSLFEFFNGLDVARRFPPALSGDELAELVSAEQPFVTAVLRRGYPVAEVVYPFDRPGARYTRNDPLPWLLVATLPRISDDPDRLFDETVAWIRGQPSRPAAEQYRALFRRWAQQLGKSGWVERSGSAVDYVGELHRHFPEARFLHIHRDGVEVALSMREHHAYRLAVSLAYDLELEDGTPVSAAGTLDIHGPPDEAGVVSRILRGRPAADAFGRYWADQMRRGLDALSSIPRGHVKTVRFEELVTTPAAVLREVADFFELGRGSWIDRAAALANGPPPSRRPTLAAGEATALEAVCREIGDRLGS